MKLITKDNVVAMLGALNSPCALAMVPIAIMGVYLFLAGKLGAFEAL